MGGHFLKIEGHNVAPSMRIYNKTLQSSGNPTMDGFISYFGPT